MFPLPLRADKALGRSEKMSSSSSLDPRTWYFINVDSRLLNGVAKGTLLGVNPGGGAL